MGPQAEDVVENLEDVIQDRRQTRSPIFFYSFGREFVCEPKIGAKTDHLVRVIDFQRGRLRGDGHLCPLSDSSDRLILHE